jgi:hypothetical protein
MKCTDFYPYYNLVLARWFSFSNGGQQELQRLRHDLHEELARCQAGKPKLDWNAYARRINAICRADGCLPLFAGAN